MGTPRHMGQDAPLNTLPKRGRLHGECPNEKGGENKTQVSLNGREAAAAAAELFRGFFFLRQQHAPLERASERSHIVAVGGLTGKDSGGHFRSPPPPPPSDHRFTS